MKKFTLVALAMMASASCFAQTTFWDGEHSNIGDAASGFWDRCNPVVVANPLKDGINKTDKCVKFTITGNNFDNGSIVLPINNGLDMSTNKRLSIMIMKPLWSNVIIELSNGTYHKRIAANYDGGNEGKWQKLVFDFSEYHNDLDVSHPTELAIYPMLEDGQTGPQDIYVDNIVHEDNPTVNGYPLGDAEKGSLEGNLNLTGSYFNTTYFIVDPWTKKTIDDFAELNNKLSANVTSIDMRNASTLGVDINKFFEGKNPNTIVYAKENYEHANVVVVGADGTGTANSLELTDANAFNAPYEFKAESVKLTRSVREGINSFVLPFAVTADELGATKVATYDSYDKDGDKKAYFNPIEEVAANTPFLTMDVAKDKVVGELTFGEKTIVAPQSLGEVFVGVYAPQSAANMYGIDDKGMLHKGGADATIAAFHAYLNVTAPLGVAFNGSTPTAINGVAADKTVNTAVYDLSGRRVYGKLSKGLYIMNGKKVVVK